MKEMTQEELIEYLRSPESKKHFDEMRKKSKKMIESFKEAERLGREALNIDDTIII